MTTVAAAPHPARALAGLLLNLIVIPGLGTLVSGDARRRRTGWVQLSIAVVLVPAIALITSNAWSPPGLSQETIRSTLSNLMLALALWSAITSGLILIECWKSDRAARGSA